VRLKEKVALITGSSRGVGRAIALAYAREGASVVVNYTSNQTAAEEVVEEIKKNGSRATLFKADVAKAAEAEALVRMGSGNRHSSQRRLSLYSIRCKAYEGAK